MANRLGLTLIESTTRYEFPIAKDPTKPNRDVIIKPREWEEGDVKSYWKKALHPWNGGLDEDRFKWSTKYAKGNIDASNEGILVPPPLLNTVASGFTSPTGSGVTSNGGGASTTGAVSIESALVSDGMVAGDIIICVVAYNDADASTITDTGGTLTAVGNRQVNGSVGSRVFYKIYAGPTVTYNFDFTNTCDAWVIEAFIFKGNNSSSPLDQSSSSTDSTSPYSCPTITPGNDYEIVFGVVAKAGVNPPDPVAPFTLAGGTFGSAGSGIAVAVSYNVQTTAAAVTPSFTGSDTTGTTWSFSFTSNKIGFSGISKFVDFNSRKYTFNNKSLVSVDSSYVQRQAKLFASNITDIAVFNNELFIALGYSTKIWKMTTAEVFTEATDNTYAGKFAAVGKQFWRSTAANTVSSCTTAPLTLSSWGADYTVGNTTWEINLLIDYGGILNVCKQDGVYTPDVNTDFWNQTPQLAQWPHADNCKGAFVAKGYLWIPSVAGLLRLKEGESLVRGPEKTYRPDYRWWVRGGFEWSEAIYLIANDQATSSQSVIVKMLENENIETSGHEYIYHEWCRLGSTDIPYCTGISIYPTNPSILIGQSAVIKYVKLGRGGGKDIDDANYGYGLSWEIETGSIRPVQDLSLVTGLIGVVITTDQDASETIDTIQYKIENGNYTNMLTDQESGSGTMPITNTSGYAAITRYADKTTNQGQFFGFKFAGSLSDAHLGTDRPEIREIFAFGYTRPKLVDLITIPIYAEPMAIVGQGMHKGKTAGQIYTQLARWKRDQTTLSFELADYEEGRTTRGRIVDISAEEVVVDKSTAGIEASTKVIYITLVRDDFAGTLYNA